MHRIFAYYGSSSDYHHSSNGLNLVIWLAVPLIVMMITRLFTGGRRRRRGIGMTIVHLLLYATVSFLLWHYLRLYSHS